MALAFDPAKGELEDKTQLDVDRSKMLPVAEWKDDCTQVVLLSCGSYSPPTIMHTRIFESAKDYFHIDHPEKKIQIVGGFMSPVNFKYGKRSLYSESYTAHRVEMVKLALKSSSWVGCDEWEVIQTDWTRTKIAIDRMAADLEKAYGVFIEKDITGILDHGVVCITRKDSNAQDTIEANPTLTAAQGNIHLVHEWDNDVSSSNARASLHKGKSVKYWLDEGVVAYIVRHGLYLTPPP